MSDGLARHREVWLVDFEFQASPGDRPAAVCMVAREHRSGRTLRLWQDELSSLREAPFDVGSDSLFVAFYASAELGCFLQLGWPLPENVLDLFAEFRNRTNGLRLVCGASLLGALTACGLDSMGAARKDGMRELILRGPPFSQVEQRSILAYCEEDVRSLGLLLDRMLPSLDWERACLRGRYMKASAWMEWRGVPVDAPLLDRLQDRWETLKTRLIARVDQRYGVFDGTRFQRAAWEAWLTREGVPWPRLPSGQLALGDDVFRVMAERHPEVGPLRELRSTLGKLRSLDLSVGHDGRNRCLLSAFRSRTGRNQPSNSRFVFGAPAWLRGLVRPGPGKALAYLDYGQQELGIAAALSEDANLLAAYRAGDPYLAFARMAGAVPEGATAESHPRERSLFKRTALAVQYGQGPMGLATALGIDLFQAQQLLDRHRAVFRRFWAWSDGVIDYATSTGALHTALGWLLHVAEDANPRSLRNYPMQANGSEILRLACCLATEAGVAVCAPVHDALLIEADEDAIAEAVSITQEAMQRASEGVLGGFALRTDVRPVTHPERLLEKRGRFMWNTVMDLLDEGDNDITPVRSDRGPPPGPTTPPVLSHVS